MSDTLALAVIGHLVGDFLLQNDWMVAHKKSSSLVCALHAAIWTLAVAAFASWWVPSIMLWLFVTHFVQDRGRLVAIWMDAAGQETFRTGPCAPWSAIVVDQVWHLVVLAFAWRVWMGV